MLAALSEAFNNQTFVIQLNSGNCLCAVSPTIQMASGIEEAIIGWANALIKLAAAALTRTCPAVFYEPRRMYARAFVNRLKRRRILSNLRQLLSFECEQRPTSERPAGKWR